MTVARATTLMVPRIAAPYPPPPAIGENGTGCVKNPSDRCGAPLITTYTRMRASVIKANRSDATIKMVIIRSRRWRQANDLIIRLPSCRSRSSHQVDDQRHHEE